MRNRTCSECGIELNKANSYPSVSDLCRRHHNLRTSKNRRTRKTQTRVRQLTRVMTFASGKRFQVPGVIQPGTYRGETHTIHSLAKSLKIAPAEVRNAIHSGRINAQGVRTGTRTRWLIPLSQVHRMAKLAGAGHDMLWNNRGHTKRLIKTILSSDGKRIDQKLYMQKTRIDWLRKASKNKSCILVALTLRTISGITARDSLKDETPFVLSMKDLSKICGLSKFATQSAVKSLVTDDLITKTRRGSSPSVYRVINAAPIKEETA